MDQIEILVDFDWKKAVPEGSFENIIVWIRGSLNLRGFLSSFVGRGGGVAFFFNFELGQ